jgi:hypothetical protein
MSLFDSGTSFSSPPLARRDDVKDASVDRNDVGARITDRVGHTVAVSPVPPKIIAPRR